jgi:hypothetical protein
MRQAVPGAKRVLRCNSRRSQGKRCRKVHVSLYCHIGRRRIATGDTLSGEPEPVEALSLLRARRDSQLN